MGSGPASVHIRSDLTIPVFQFETETDVGGGVGMTGFSGSRQPDTDHLRTWEVAGTSHADQYLLNYSAANPAAGDAGSLTSSCTDINNGPQHWIEDAAVAALHAWLKDGTPPPHGDPLTFSDAGSGFAKDAIGNALGGVRSPAVDVPIDILSGVASSGGRHPLRALRPNHAPVRGTAFIALSDARRLRQQGDGGRDQGAAGRLHRVCGYAAHRARGKRGTRPAVMRLRR